MKAIVVGGGVGGLSLALNLHQIGFDPALIQQLVASRSITKIRPLAVDN